MKKRDFIHDALIICLVLYLTMPTGCSEKNPVEIPSEPIEYLNEEIRGDCLDDPMSMQETTGYLILEVHGNDLHIIHAEAHYQCCLEYLVEYEFDDFDITASEFDTGPLCDCYCYFDLRSIVYDLLEGLYVVTLIGIQGDTVGVDSAYVGG